MNVDVVPKRHDGAVTSGVGDEAVRHDYLMHGIDGDLPVVALHEAIARGQDEAVRVGEEIAMADACPVLTPEERKASEILDNARRAMMEKVHAAVAEAAAQVREQVLAAGLDFPPTPKAYFDAVVHQRMFLTICGAAVGTFEGGSAEKAIGLIRNQQFIANRYWGAKIEVTPKAA